MKKKFPTRTAVIELADDANALFRLKWNDIGKGSGETENQYATITISKNGSTASKLIVLLNIGASSTSYSQYQFSAGAIAVADPSGIDSSPTHTQCTTLGAMIKAINALGPKATKHTSTSALGLWATRLHAPADYSLDTDDFIDLAESRIGSDFTEYLYKDASEVLTMAYRLGVPENIKGLVGAGQFQLELVKALVNSDSATDCVITMSYDPDETDATQENELGFTRYVPDNAWTDLFDYTDNPPVLRGPVLIELTSTTSMAAGAKCLINYSSYEY